MCAGRDYSSTEWNVLCDAMGSCTHPTIITGRILFNIIVTDDTIICHLDWHHFKQTATKKHTMLSIQLSRIKRLSSNAGVTFWLRRSLVLIYDWSINHKSAPVVQWLIRKWVTWNISALLYSWVRAGGAHCTTPETFLYPGNFAPSLENFASPLKFTNFKG